jgi:tyrosine-protein kinase Etk/Wzc
MMDPINSGRNPSFQSNESGNDIKRYLSLFISNWYWFAFSFFIALTIAYAINRYSEQVFTASSSMLIKDEQKSGGLSSAENFVSGANIFRSQQNLRNEIGILKSFSLNKRVIDSLPDFHITYVGLGRRNIVERQLYRDCPFEVITDSIDPQTYGVQVNIRILSNIGYSLKIDETNQIYNLAFGKQFKENGFNLKIRLREPEDFKYDERNSNKFYFNFNNPVELANSYRNKLNVAPVDKDATLVSLSVSGLVPQQEVDYLNKLMELYVMRGLELKNQTADSTISFIDRQLGIISDSLYKAERKLMEFRLLNKFIDLSKEGTLIQNRLEQFENEKITLELQKKYYEYLISYLSSKNESGDIVSPSIMGVTDQLLTRLVQELATAQQQKKQLSMNLNGELPPVNLLEENIRTAKKALAENVNSSLYNINQSITEVNKNISITGNEVMKLPVTERNLIEIQRTFDLNNSVYTYLLEKRSEAGIAKASNVPDNRIIDMADVLNSILIKPQTKKNYLIGMFLAFIIPIVCIYILEFLNNKIIDKKDIENGTQAPIIGYISHNEEKNEMPLIKKPGSILAESFRSIRTSLKYFIKETDHPVISVTSTISSEGKTFISLNLAIITAMLGKKVLLIGLDLRKPRIHKVFEINNDIGISTFLSGNCKYKEVIQKTPLDNLFYAASGPVPPNPAELIESSRMKYFFDQVKKEFDFMYIDTPPLAVVSDALLLTDFVDVNIFVVRQRFSSKHTLELIQEFYQAGKFKNIGIIVNDISLSGYYGYGLRYGYSMGYGYSYGSNYYGRYVYERYGYSDKEHGYYTD